MMYPTKELMMKLGYMRMRHTMKRMKQSPTQSSLTPFPVKVGQDGRWVNLVMACVSIVLYSFVINGGVCGSMSLSRGLHQGDPLSPYLFILVANAFSRMLQSKVQENQIHGAKVSRNGPIISHLLFADDSLLFTRATR